MPKTAPQRNFASFPHLAFLVALFAAATLPANAESPSATLFLRQNTPILVDDTPTGSNYTGAHDAELKEESPDSNFDNGTGSSGPPDTEFKLDGSDSSFVNHVVIRFDSLFGNGIDQIPLGAQINSASLFIDIDNTGDDFSVYQVAPSVAQWNDTTVTWNNFGAGSDGASVGTDTTGSPVAGPGGGNKVNLDVTAIVQNWSDGDANRGFAFVPGGSDGVDFDTSENTDDSDDRPSLTISYTVINPLAPTFTQDPVNAAAASATNPYTGDLNPFVTDADTDPLTFTKESGPAWLNVAANGTLSGTPVLPDIGFNSFTVCVTDNGDGTDLAELKITVNDENGNPPPPESDTGRYRLIWLDNPSTTVIVAWEQNSGAAGTVHYGPTDQGRIAANYPNSISADREITYRGMDNCFARITGLTPDTPYYFTIQDANGPSPRFWFRTAPATTKPFTFIAGGDSRNNRTPRQRANRLVAKLRPLFVPFTGDMIDSDTDSQWQEWLDDWQESITADGRIIPLLPHRGNHEDNNDTVYNLFDTTAVNYYALSFGGSLLRYYVLNSETTQGGTQGTWLTNDLTTNAASHNHLVAGYHKPMRPHTSSKSEGSDEYDAWANLFFTHGMDLVCESDSHTMKRTHPVAPSTGTGSEEGFIQSNSFNATVYIGEGCWGAPLRAADDTKAWTLAGGQFNGFDLVHVYPDRMENYTVQVDTEAAVTALKETEHLALPPGITLWNPASGIKVIIGKDSPGAPKQSYAAWQVDQYGTNIPASSLPFADADNDGTPNVLERIFGFDPDVVDIGAEILVRAQNDTTLFVEFSLDPGVDRDFDVQYSEDLINYVTLIKNTDYLETVTPVNGMDFFSLQIIGAKGAIIPSSSKFFRIVARP
ncbi:MAG: DNRLRE domain-containing protein [Verrucomicrobiota bacterium]